MTNIIAVPISIIFKSVILWEKAESNFDKTAIPKKNNIRKEDNGVNSVLKKIKPNLGCFFVEINLICSTSFLKTLPYSKIIIVEHIDIIIINEYGP